VELIAVVEAAAHERSSPRALRIRCMEWISPLTLRTRRVW
jgi:hypothetical protein